jgi:hypothetical protein
MFIHSRGHHEASWRHQAASPLALTDIRYYQDLAQRAEADLFDSIFLADQLALGDMAPSRGRQFDVTAGNQLARWGLFGVAGRPLLPRARPVIQGVVGTKIDYALVLFGNGTRMEREESPFIIQERERPVERPAR